MAYQNVLLIDDDEDDLEIFCMAVRKVSPELNCVLLTDPREALEKLNTKTIHPDAIFLDVNMPAMNGLDFLKQLKSSNELSRINVYMISTASDPSTIASAKQLGARDFITKPGRLEELVTILQPIINN